MMKHLIIKYINMYIVNRPISLNHIPNRFFLQIIELEPKEYLKMYEMYHNMVCLDRRDVI